MAKKVGIIGAGWLGIRLARHFKANFEVYTTTRTADKFESLRQEGLHPTFIEFSGEAVQESIKPWSLIPALDILIITVNFSKSTEISVLQKRFENVCRFIRGFDQQTFLMSSIGIYPPREQAINEETIAENELQPNIWSVEQQMRKALPQINILRLGGLMGDDRYLSKYTIKETAQIANHIHYDDIAGVIEQMIQAQSSRKTYNVVAPEHPTKQAILDEQLGASDSTEDAKPFGKVVLTRKLVDELGYTYTRPDPRVFNLN